MFRTLALRAARTVSFCSRLLGIALVTALAVLAVAGPDWGKCLGVKRSYFVNCEEPTEQSAVIMRRVAAKNRVIDQLIAGEMTLVEAAAWFRYLNENPSRYRHDYRDWPGDSDEEKACRQVLSWAEVRVLSQAESKSQAAAMVQRLEDELEQTLRREGRVELPW